MGRERFKSFTISLLETDLWVGVDQGSWTPQIPPFCEETIRGLRGQLDSYIQARPRFLASLVPLEEDPEAVPIAREMIAAASKAGVGPMASVAGAFAQHLGKLLEDQFRVQELVIENGGDIYMHVRSPISMSIYAGSSPLSEKIGVVVPAGISPVGICTSSGTVGHSLSFGKADAVMIACHDALVADAFATAFCNKVQSAGGIEGVLDEIGNHPEIISAVIVVGDRMGIRGRWELMLFEK